MKLCNIMPLHHGQYILYHKGHLETIAQHKYLGCRQIYGGFDDILQVN